MSDVLKHYGILGMKWGIRKDRKTGGLSKKSTRKVDNKLLSAKLASRNMSENSGTYKTLQKQYMDDPRMKRILSDPDIDDGVAEDIVGFLEGDAKRVSSAKVFKKIISSENFTKDLNEQEKAELVRLGKTTVDELMKDPDWNWYEEYYKHPY